MKILDGHIHIWGKKDKSTELLKRMQSIGICGGCVFSPPPFEMKMDIGMDFKDRLDTVLLWTKSNPSRLFPVLWIHPDEENIEENIDTAVTSGIMAFKIICNNFYVYEGKSIKVLNKIASLGKPVFFHSGILWDGGVSSRYNRPLDWECLMSIKNLKFSMGHCSWPWYDECLALYGKFLNAYRQSECAEMFFDITPGTPEIYRKDLMYKLFNIGYDVPNNIFFGTDSSADDYKTSWPDKWIEKDNSIYDELSVGDDIKTSIYHNNLLRFLGILPKNFTHLTPTTDDGAPWYIGVERNEDTVSDVASSWYFRLGFPEKYDDEFRTLLSDFSGELPTALEFYDVSDDKTARGKNLLMYLYFCEALSEKFKVRNIPENILSDTLKDLVVWTNTNYYLTGSLGICEASWLKKHLSFTLFKLGRLQFAFGKAEADIDKIGIKKGDNIIEVHIPEGAPLKPDECEKSFDMAVKFFEKYFPEYKYKCFTCHSWLLDDTLKSVAKSGSNILKFQNMFTRVRADKSDAILRYTFKWDANKDNINAYETKSDFSKRIKEHMLNGNSFYEVYGYKVK